MCMASVVFARCGHPLRFYITPHCPQRLAKGPLGAGHRLRALRVKATGVMQSGLRWRRSHSRRRFPVAGTPYTPPSAPPCGCACTWALVRRSALGVLSVDCGQSYGMCPRPPVGLTAARLGSALVCPSAPKGAPSVSAPLLHYWRLHPFAIKRVAAYAMNMGAKGLKGL